MILCSFLIFVLSSKHAWGIKDEFKSSLSFVIDDTYSMHDDIDEVKLGANAIFDTVLRNKASQIKNFVLVTFNDHGNRDRGVILRSKTTDREDFKNALSDINVHGGDDCPEYSMSGIKRALEESEDRSFIYVFTDAAAKDHDEYEEIQYLAQQKQCQLIFVLTGRCGRSDAPNHQVYYQMARATNGQVFNVRKHEVSKVLEYVKKTITGRRTTIVTEKLPPGKSHMTFNADVIMGEVTLSLASDEVNDPSVAIKAPDGSAVWNKILFETDKVQVYSVDVTMPGPHTVEVNSKTETRAVISARSGVDFQHGFSAYKLSSLIDTSTRPAPGTKSHLSIKLNEGDIKLQTVQILDMNDNVILELPLETSKKDAKFYSSPAFKPPNTLFKIAVIGYDPLSKTNITRAIPTPVEPQKLPAGKKVSDTRPSVTIDGSPVIYADFDNPLQLVCKVNAFPKPRIVWTNKVKGMSIEGEVSILELPYNYMSVLSIEKVHESSTYECQASNVRGSDSGHVGIRTTVKDKFDIIDTPKKVKASYHKEAQISCKIDAYPPAVITWYKRGVKIIPSDNIQISSDNSVVTIKRVTPDDKGKYMCEARNKNHRKLIYRYLSVFGVETPEIDKELSDISVKKNSTVTINCKILKGIPKPSINWYHRRNSKSFPEKVEKWNNMETISVTVSSTQDAGSYTCEAVNDVGTDYHQISLHLDYPPSIKKSSKEISATPGGKVNIPCAAEGGPSPNVTWYKDDVEIVSSATIRVLGDQTLSFIAQPSDSGSYTCKATNEHGTDSKTVEVEVTVPISIKLPESSKISALVGSSVTLMCEASGQPKPELKWMYHSFDSSATMHIRGSAKNKLTLDSLQKSNEGYYTCAASNTKGSMNITYEVHVLLPPYIKKTISEKKFKAAEGDLVLRINCQALGNPKPKVTWTKGGLNLALGNTYYIEDGNLIIKNVPLDATGTYICKASNHLGTAQEVYEVEVLGSPRSTGAVRTIYLESSKYAEIDCSLSVDPLGKLQWYRHGKLVSVGKLKIASASTMDDGEYICRTTDFHKTATETVNVVVGTKPYLLSASDENLELSQESLPSLSCENGGHPAPKVEWYYNDNKLNETRTEYTLTDWTKSGQYRCVVTNYFGSVNKTFNVVQRDCYINTKILRKLHPIMLTPGLEWPIPYSEDEFMIFMKGDQFVLYCSSGFATLSNPNKYIDAFCDSGSNFLINGIKYDYFNIQCKEETKHEAFRTGQKCLGNSTEIVKIGYDLSAPDKGVVYEVCMDNNNEVPLYAKQVMFGPIGDSKIPTAWSDANNFEIKFDEAYDCGIQILQISAILRTWFHKDDKCCYAKRQLVNPADVFPGATQASTFSYYNVVPHWSTCNADNWEEIERRVRNLSQNSFSELLVWTGTAEEYSMKNNRRNPVKVFKDRRGVSQPLPMYLWKVVQNPISKESLAIVQVNIPDLRKEDARSYIRCRNVCDTIDWMKNSDWSDVNKGYTYCCKLDEFQAAFGFNAIFEPDMTSLLSDTNLIPEGSLIV